VFSLRFGFMLLRLLLQQVVAMVISCDAVLVRMRVWATFDYRVFF
jgi:hypothetical protein